MARRTPWQPAEGEEHCSVATVLCFAAVQDVRLHMAAGGNFEHVALTLYQCGTLQVGGGLAIDCITQSVERHTAGRVSSRASSAVCGCACRSGHCHACRPCAAPPNLSCHLQLSPEPFLAFCVLCAVRDGQVRGSG